MAVAALLAVSCNKEVKQEAPATPTPDAAPVVVQNSASINADGTTDMHNAQNSLDWAGTYKGKLPSASGEGIETTITLKDDMTFEKVDIYKGKKGGKFTEKGKFTWDKEGTVITLEIKDAKELYKVVEGSIIMLNADGKENTGELAEMYVIKKVK